MITLIKGATVVMPNGKTQTSDIVIQGNKIKSVGMATDDLVADNVINGKGKLAVPGFVNAHTHASIGQIILFSQSIKFMSSA